MTSSDVREISSLMTTNMFEQLSILFYAIIKNEYIGNNVYRKDYDLLVIKACFRSDPTTDVF